MAKQKFHTPKEKKGFDWTLNIKESKKRIHFAPTTQTHKNKKSTKRALRGSWKPEY